MKINFRKIKDESVFKIEGAAKDGDTIAGGLEAWIIPKIRRKNIIILFDELGSSCLAIYETIFDEEGIDPLFEDAMYFFDNFSLIVLEALQVDKEFRGKKIGTKLMSGFLKRYCKTTVTMLLAENDAEEERRDDLYKFYEKLGFKRYNDTDVMYKLPDGFLEG